MTTNESTMAPSTDTIHVLHVDDPSVTDVVASALEREDDQFLVRAATIPDKGLEMVADGDVDCVVAGYDLPDGDGLSFLEAVRESDPDLPFVLHADPRSEAVAE